jgi:tetratricopeptide (TPR) repeat protein
LDSNLLGGILLSIYSLIYDPAKARYEDAHAYAKDNKYQTAVELYGQAIDSGLKDPKVYFDRGYAYLQIQKNDLATQDFEKYTKLVPNDPYGYFNLGLAYHNQGKTDFAIPNYKRVIEINTAERLTQMAGVQLQNLGAK